MNNIFVYLHNCIYKYTKLCKIDIKSNNFVKKSKNKMSLVLGEMKISPHKNSKN